PPHGGGEHRKPILAPRHVLLCSVLGGSKLDFEMACERPLPPAARLPLVRGRRERSERGGSLTHHLELQYVASELESLHDTGCSNRWCSAFRNAGTERRATSTYRRCLKRAAAR